MPALRRQNEVVKAGAPDRVRLLAVGLESEEVLSSYLERNGLTAFQVRTVTRDADVAPIAMRTPTLVPVDQAGKVKVTWTGAMTPDQVDKVVQLHGIGQ